MFNPIFTWRFSNNNIPEVGFIGGNFLHYISYRHSCPFSRLGTYMEGCMYAHMCFSLFVCQYIFWYICMSTDEFVCPLVQLYIHMSICTFLIWITIHPCTPVISSCNHRMVQFSILLGLKRPISATQGMPYRNN